jgi:L-lactate dehydrogenase (cytochrome)
MNLEKCHNQSDLRKAAKKRLPSPIFNYIDGGSDDEWTLKRNTLAFDDYELLPRYLRNVDRIDLKTRVLGTTIDLPVFLAPTGMSRLFHHDREIAVAKAAEKFGTLYSLSTLGTTSIEEIAQVSSGPRMFQIYILKDQELTREFMQRCKDSDYDVMCLTVDAPLAGNRERDLVSGFTMPPRFSLKSLWSFATHPYWAMHLVLNPDFELRNIVHRVDKFGKKGVVSLISYINDQFDRAVTWEDAAWLAEQWDGPFVIKGLQTAEDAKRAVDAGASAIMISNHGGRQLESAPAPVDCIVPIREAVGDSLELIVDGGIKRGTHIIKALALGADACSIGRGYLYGLGAGGQKGVERALELYRSELLRGMALLGCTKISDINAESIRHVASTYKGNQENGKSS